MFANNEEHNKEVSPKNNTQLSSINIDGLMNSVHNTFYNADMTGDTAFISSENLSFRLC